MKTAIRNNYESVLEYLNELSNSELVSIHNKYCQSINDCDNEIHHNEDDFFETFFDGRVIEAVRAISYGDYNYNHNFVMFDGYANLKSFDDPTDEIDLSDIANDILENPENYYDIELEDEEEPEEDTDEEMEE